MIIAPTRIEPARLDDVPEAIADLANELTLQSSQLGRNLPDRTLQDLAAMVRLMNSYYSNRIEGHNTRPRDIERALAGDFDDDPARRALQREAAAHVCLQAVIDERAAAGILEDPSEGEFIKWLHREFYRDAAPDMLIISDKITMVPGVWRDRDVDLLDLADALAELVDESRRLHDVVMLHWFAGMTHAAVAEHLGVSTSTAEKDFRYALAWLKRRLQYDSAHGN